MIETFRGHAIKPTGDSDGFVFCDTGESTIDTWKDRPCGHCDLFNTPEGHDGCLGTLLGVMNACCGHGNPAEAYVQFSKDHDLRSQEALDWVAMNYIFTKSRQVATTQEEAFSKHRSGHAEMNQRHWGYTQPKSMKAENICGCNDWWSVIFKYKMIPGKP